MDRFACRLGGKILEILHTLEEKKQNLKLLLREYLKEDVCVAFSGGVDSSLLLVMAWEAAKESTRTVYALTMDTVLHPAADLEAARLVLERTGAKHVVLKLNELAVPEIRMNPLDRCYLCKKELYTRMLKFGEEHGVRTLLEGSNEDDLHVYRPGLKAVKELGVKSPLAMLRITKEEVRALAREYGIPVADRPSSPCLATRLPYGTEIDLTLLERIDKSEEFIRGLDFYNVRVRVHKDIARVEIDQKDFFKFLDCRQEITRKLKDLGFAYVTLDLEGFRSGSMDAGRREENGYADREN